ncbi:MAG: diguanylate cyclase, partial [Spirulinaceae cyanobacterium]
ASEKKPPGIASDRVEDDEILSIPLVNQDRVLGKLHLRPGANLPYGATQKQLAIALAEQITLAIVNVTLRETLEAESIRDALTHLYNRRYLSKTLPEALNLAQQQQQSLCVVMVDVDHFKRFNDTWGHQAGDRVLELVGSYFDQNIRHNDIAYRYGGEEFAIVLQNIEAATAYHRIEQLRQGLRNLPIVEGDRHLYITVSCGIASFPQNGQTASQLLKAADLALYQAKAQGRDRTIFAIPEYQHQLP